MSSLPAEQTDEKGSVQRMKRPSVVRTKKSDIQPSPLSAALQRFPRNPPLTESIRRSNISGCRIVEPPFERSSFLVLHDDDNMPDRLSPVHQGGPRAPRTDPSP